MAIEATVDALVLAHWAGDLSCVKDTWGQIVRWEAVVSCTLTPYEAGQPITGQELQQLSLLGFEAAFEATIPYPGEAAPATAQVGADMLTWVGQTHAAAAAEWVGKRATAFVADGE